MNNDRGWGTDSDLKFIMNIGHIRRNLRGASASEDVDRKQLLKNYIRAAARRNNWGAINRNKVLAVAEAELAKL